MIRYAHNGTRSLCLAPCFLALFFGVLLVKGCKEYDPMRLRNASGEWFSPDYIHLMIVGDGHPIDPDGFESATVSTADGRGKACPHSIEVLETKMGPAISIVVDGRSAREVVVLSGRLVYAKTEYRVEALWREEGDGTRPWRLTSCEIHLAEPSADTS